MRLDHKGKLACKKSRRHRTNTNLPIDVNVLVNKITDLEMQLKDVTQNDKIWRRNPLEFIQSGIIMFVLLIGFFILWEILRHIIITNTPLLNSYLRGPISNEDLYHSYSSTVEASALLSTLRPVMADIPGALGPPQVVTDETVANWLSDRWQAPLTNYKEEEGIVAEPHWLEVDLQRLCLVRRVVIDWENAYSDDWIIQGRVTAEQDWIPLADSSHAKQIETKAYHIVQEVLTQTQTQSQTQIHDLTASRTKSVTMSAPPSHFHSIRFVRLLINKSSTKWGVSIWRIQIWGLEL